MRKLTNGQLSTVLSRLDNAQELVLDVMRDTSDLPADITICEDDRLDEATAEVAAVIDLLQLEREAATL